MIPEPGRAAYLLALERCDNDGIVRRLSLSADQVERLITETERQLTQGCGGLPGPVGVLDDGADRVDRAGPARAAERRRLVRAALGWPDLVTVAVGDDLMGHADLGVWVDHLVAHESSDGVDACIAGIEGVDYVTMVRREDREFVAVYGDNIDPGEVLRRLRAWWRQYLQSLSELSQ